MRPTLVDFGIELPLLGPLSFPAYFTLLVIGFACALHLTAKDARRLGLDERRIVDWNLLMALSGLVGARILHVFTDGQLHDYVNLCLDPVKVPAADARVSYCTDAVQCGFSYLCDSARHICYPPRDCLSFLKFWRGGLVFYGGLILATAVGLWYIRRSRLPLLRTCDLAGHGIPLGLFFGRLGCYLNGCCYGLETTVPWGARFPMGSLAHEAQVKAGHVGKLSAALPVHPTQLYEAVGCLAIFAFAYFWLRPRKRWDGQLLAWSAVLYAILRASLELLRDDARGVWGGVSTSQIISIPVAIVGIVLIVRARRAARAPEAA